VEAGSLQLSSFDKRGLAEISSPEFPGERLIVCRNPLLAAERSRKRAELLAATECALEQIAAATRRSARTLAKVHSKRTAEGFPVHSFRTLLQHLATLKSNVPKTQNAQLSTCSPPPPQSSNAPSTCSTSRL